MPDSVGNTSFHRAYSDELSGPEDSVSDSRPKAGAASTAASRQYRTAQRLRHAIGANKVWACDRCYRLKIKCDSGKPACSACVKHDIGDTCTYGGSERTNSSSRRGRRYDTTGYVRMLEARVREVEGWLQNKGQPDDSPATPLREHQNQDMRRSHRPSYSRAEQDLPPLSASYVRTVTELVSPSRSVARPFLAHDDLFAPDLQMELVRLFLRIINPLIWASPYHDSTITAKLCLERPSHSEFLVMGMCAMAAPFSDHPAIKRFMAENGLPTYAAGNAYAKRGQEILDTIINEPSLDLVVGTVWLACAVSQSGRGGSSKDAYLAQALSIARHINLNIDPDVEEVHGVLPWLLKETRRRVWWLLVSLDIISAIPTPAEAPSIDGRDHPLTERTPCLQGWRPTPRAPAPEALFQSVATLDGLPRLSAFVPGEDFDSAENMVTLTKLYARIKALRGSAWSMAERAAKIASQDVHPTAAINRARMESISELENALTAWFSSLPDWVQNIDRINQFAASPASQSPPSWQLVTMHVYYHAAHISLHLPTILDTGFASLSPSEQLGTKGYASGAYNICVHHAICNAALLCKIADLDPEGLTQGPWLALFSFYSALVLVIAMRIKPPPHFGSDFRPHLEAHFKVLQLLAPRWYPAGSILNVLMAVLAENEELDDEAGVIYHHAK
ncbi:uncharacterized protein EV422DRAFT_515401 [Fimicolochytrium jonesii]|uniref:uncharacterized protein n=1 Tax=Fimicolochytrium jonesii TaxID=1396493 RepID=UPI0022FDC229|nr:uncharacterized protein EV422DRAFT_515401 [Fimicolochytrium jonesii]KAI8826111.1 hypothetical protein EV422DRAFT_515401 [Fimicolochytrium jonesii]